MRDRTKRIAVGGAALVCAGVTGALAQGAAPSWAAIAEAQAPPGLQLVDADREFRDAFLKALEEARGAQPDKAVESLHALITGDRIVFYPHPTDPRRHLPSVESAAWALGLFPPEALERYDRAYDPAARRLYEQAAAEMSEPALLRAARLYPHTRHGVMALNLFGSLAFDRGAYLDAAHAWETACRRHSLAPGERALVLAKAAVANHLGGCGGRAVALLSALEAQYPGVKGSIAGTERALAPFVRAALAQPAPRPAGRPGVTDWTSLAGAPDSVAVMPDCAVSSLALWKQTEAERLGNVRAILLAPAENQPDRGATRIAPALEGGRARVAIRPPGEPEYAFELPALVHPVVIASQGVILSRREQGIECVAADSGRPLWKTAAFPLHEAGTAGKTPNHYLPLAGDMGRYALTAADGRVFAVGEVRRIDPETYRKFASTLETDTSALAAFSAADGKPLWRVGGGTGDVETIRTAKYLTAPTHHRGRLYAPVKVGNRYQVMCLDAATGRHVWSTPVGPIPTHTGEQLSWQAAYTMEIMTERASPVAVAGGRVYLTTNAGLVAALDAETGAPVWAHRYDSRVSGKPGSADTSREVTNLAFLISAARRPFWPQNPVVLAEGRVICLPCDSDVVFALHAATGERLWDRPRQGLQDLSAVDEGRVALTGPSFLLLAVRDGAALRSAQAAVSDRPAVTANAVLASGAGRIVRFDLNDGSLGEQAVSDPDALLGRLVSAGGKLVAVNSAGVSVYLGFEEAWAATADSLARTKDAVQKAQLHTQRGLLALQADRPAAAAAEFRAAEQAASRAGRSEVAASVRPRLCQSVVRQAQTSEGDAEASALLDEALALAAGDEEKAWVTAEQIRCHDRFGRPQRAAELAQALSEQYADTPVRLPGAGETPPTGYGHGQAEILRLIQAHGRSAYAAFDARLGAALEEGKRSGDVDALLAARNRWPHAARADELLFAAAETLYRRAVAAKPPDRSLAMRASRVLGELRSGSHTRLVPDARALQAVLDKRFRPAVAETLHGDARTLAGAVGAAGATLLADLTNVVEVRTGIVEPDAVLFADLSAPLRRLYASPEGRTAVLRDGAGRPVLLGDRFFTHDKASVACVDSLGNAWENARQWSAPVAPFETFWSRVGHLSAESKRLAVAGTGELAIFDALSGRELARRPLNAFGVGPWSRVAAEGDRLVFADVWGNVTCVNVASEKQEWRLSARQGRVEKQSLQAACDVVFAEQGGREAALFLDVRTGHELLRVDSRRRDGVRGAINPDGFGFVYGADQVCRLHDPRRGAAGVVSQGNLANFQHEVMAFGHRYAVLRDETEPHRVAIFDIAAALTPVKAEIRDADGRPCAVSSAEVIGRTAIVLCGETAANSQALRNPILAGLRLPDGAVLWRLALGSDKNAAYRVSRPHVFGSCVSVLSASREESQAGRCAVADWVAGKWLVGGPGAGETGAIAGLQPWSRSPVILNGRMVVESDSGVVVFRGSL